MTPTLITRILDFGARWGIAGVMLMVAIVALWWLHKTTRSDARSLHESHVSERREWRKDSDKQFDTLVQVARDSNVVLTKLTVLLETRRERS